MLMPWLNTVEDSFEHVSKGFRDRRIAFGLRCGSGRAATSCRKRSSETQLPAGLLQEIMDFCGVRFRHERNAKERKGMQRMGRVGIKGTTVWHRYCGLSRNDNHDLLPQEPGKGKQDKRRTSCKGIIGHSKLCTSTIIPSQVLRKSCCPKLQRLFARGCYCSNEVKIPLFWLKIAPEFFVCGVGLISDKVLGRANC